MYSKFNPEVLNPISRQKMALQILSVIKDYYSLKNLKEAKVLDMGSSSGIITSFLADYAQEMIGIDSDPQAISVGNKQFKRTNLKLLKMDATDLKFEDESFDIVICSQVYYDVNNCAKLFAEIERVLKKDGICFFAGVSKYYLWENQYKLPFLNFLPVKISKVILKITKKEPVFYLGKYKSYWQLKRELNNFKIYPYTAKILKNPVKFNYYKIKPFRHLTKLFPESFYNFLEPASPNFIWILKK
jgi:ubiquinone/menaquinone biosynthesis C-methylase UbiE